MDAIVAHQHGLTNAVALMGTSVNIRRIALILRYCDRFTLCFDFDAAGTEAKMKAISSLHSFGVTSISEIALPEGSDPDEYLTKFGAQSLVGLSKELSTQEIKKYVKAYDYMLEVRKKEAQDARRERQNNVR